MTEAALLAAILDAPEDDAPRLIYSDWLEEQGQDERAEFIKVQCAIAHTPAWRPTECDVCGNTSDETGTIEHGRGCHVVDEDGGGSSAADSNPVHESLRRRERELFERRGTDWLADYFGVFAGVGAKMSRGFIHSITCTAEDLLAHGDKIIAPVPLPEVILPSWQPVEEVTLTTWPNMLTWFPKGRLISYHETSLAAFERLAKGRWGRIKKWTLPPEYDVGPLIEAAMVARRAAGP